MHRTTHIEPMRLRRDANIDLSQHVLNTRWERSIQQSLSSGTRAKPKRTIAQHHAIGPTAAGHDLASHSFRSCVSTTALPRPASTRGDMHVSTVCCASMPSVHTPPATRRVASGINHVQRKQSARRHALSSTLLHRCHAALTCVRNEDPNNS